MSIQTETKACGYCGGQGYFQLLLGGSETCPSCKGKQKAEAK
ncbi:YuiA family protein [Bacillus badius]|uniref:YuiA family protein n=1 Tax=Bacillus badius TaxID=1455 RepID=A0ABR5AXM6_BACBA|nr:YuiA family protein [Bacillus badius]KIL75941.1 hypothetical protein SD78_0043 [Bacillus badius]KIL79499.1 hypothetical protein SD77_3365 [Bacillus badius]MED0667788.1 YuiA family protein [Bacillus badius]MED4716663.1 YuiA family protein [Bacillus badius]TDV99842.1 hypothetical protein B0G66_11939 [Bacillus badius]